MRDIVPPMLDRATVRYEPNARDLSARTIYLGVVPGDAAPGLHLLPDGPALVLTHKAFERGCRSVSRAVANLPAEDVAAMLGERLDPARPFAGLTLVAEDGSPDSCVATIALARRARGETVPEAWLDYVDRWEAGDTSSTAQSDATFGVMLSSLVHAYLPDGAEGGARDSRYTPFLLGCAFTEAMVGADTDPQDLAAARGKDPDGVALFDLARALVAADREAADRIIHGSLQTSFALEVPETGRIRVLDALVVTEITINRALKGFVRASPLAPNGQGFPILCLYRPRAAGTGYDMTFSVDPSAGVWMRAQWEALERAEDEAWARAGADRPGDFPRGDMKSWERRPEGIRPSNQPWWEGRPLYTLLAAPKRLADDQPGSRLSWGDALHAVWRTASRIAGWDLRDAADQPIDIFAPHPAAVNGIRMIELAVGPGADETLVGWGDDVARALAAYLNHGHARLELLPDSDGFTVGIAEGLAVLVSARGVLTLRLRRDSGKPVEPIRQIVARASKLHAACEDLEARIAEARPDTIAAIGDGSSAKKRTALARQYAILTEALRNEADRPIAFADPFYAKIEGRVEEFFDSRKRFDAVVAEASRLREMTATASDVITNENVNAIARFGFPFALLVNFFAFSFTGWGLMEPSVLDGLKLRPLLFWLAASLLLSLVIALLGRAKARSWRKHLDYASQPPPERSPGGDEG